MKPFFKIVIAIIIIAAAAGYIYWQQHKKGIIKDSIANAIKKKTDSLYFIHYDSSHIDEITGSASFYNVTLQSDSAQRALLKSTDSLPNTLYAVSVAEVSARGINLPGLLQKEQVSAGVISLIKPQVQIIQTGAGKPKPFTYNDTLELYRRITGKFKSIHADTINVVDGTVLITDKNLKPLATLEKINVSLYNFVVDSNHDYKNIISYFVKDVRLTVDNIQLPESKKGTRINIEKLVYDAPGKILQVGAVKQYKTGNTTALSDIKNVKVSGLNTDAFINGQQLQAGMITSEGGLITVYTNKGKKEAGNKQIEFSSDLIDEAQVQGIQLSNTKIVVASRANPDASPFIINDVKFVSTKVEKVTSGTVLSNLITDADWELSASGFSFITKDNLYKFSASGLRLNNKAGLVNIIKVELKPLLSEEAFVKASKVQRDRFDLAFNGIALRGVNFKKLLADNTIEIDNATMQADIKIFNDRTLPFDTSSKVGRYPQQLLTRIKTPFFIKTINIKNGSVFYKERGLKSKMTGTPNFTAINAAITNVTNIPSRISENKTMKLHATTLFLKALKIKTDWLLPLKMQDTLFTVTGETGSVDAAVLNQIIEPLGMASVKSGTINKLVFDVVGNNYHGSGSATFLYQNLKIEVLKMSDEELKKRGLISFLANTFIVNDNPKKGDLYVGKIDFVRDTQKSFFNLVWKSIFNGIKKTVLRK